MSCIDLINQILDGTDRDAEFVAAARSQARRLDRRLSESRRAMDVVLVSIRREADRGTGPCAEVMAGLATELARRAAAVRSEESKIEGFADTIDLLTGGA